MLAGDSDQDCQLRLIPPNAKPFRALLTSMPETNEGRRGPKACAWLLWTSPSAGKQRKTCAGSNGCSPPDSVTAPTVESYAPLYGDLIQLNQSRLILDAVGEETLHNIVTDCVGMLDTSAAVYEANGDYALGILFLGLVPVHGPSLTQPLRHC